MLPEELSAGVCSLKPREPRKCVTVEFTFAREGVRRSVAFYRSTIRSDHRLTYGFVDEVLRGHPDTGLGPVPTVAPEAAAVRDGGVSERDLTQTAALCATTCCWRPSWPASCAARGSRAAPCRSARSSPSTASMLVAA